MATLSEYTTDILDMVEEDNKVWAKVRYRGYHRGELLGHPPTGKQVGGTACRFSPLRAPECAIFGSLATFRA